MTIKIPPLLVLTILISMVYLSSSFIKNFHLENRLFYSLLLLLIGLTIIIIPVFQFILSRTTVDPVNFENVSKLVKNGIYKYTRNPMYLGMLIIILSTVIYYLNLFSVFTPIIFVLWINKFQIVPEEKKLVEIFGDEYFNYKSKSRRWL